MDSHPIIHQWFREHVSAKHLSPVRAGDSFEAVVESFLEAAYLAERGEQPDAAQFAGFALMTLVAHATDNELQDFKTIYVGFLAGMIDKRIKEAKV